MNIQITGGTMLIDECDEFLIRAHSWYVKAGTPQYAMSRINRKLCRAHRLILDAPEGMHVDHINGNGLDNRRANLRLVRRNENMWNSVKKNRGGLRQTSSQYKGVNTDYRVPNKKWNAEVWKESKKIFTRAFYTEEDAAAAYNVVASRAFGAYARLNDVPMTPEVLERILPIIDAPKRKKGLGCVTYSRKARKWYAFLSQRNKVPRKYVGGFDTETEARSAIRMEELVAA